jgi:hypothetical protein
MSPPPDGIELPPRHCGRCQRAFEGDPDLFFQTDWALCPECTEILLPSRRTAPSRSPKSIPAGANLNVNPDA